jgi:glycosyltransferase involved in cell wall biosynthesis
VDVPNEPKAPSNKTLSDIVVGTAARLVKVKGIVHLIYAAALVAARTPGVRFEIVGDGPERSALEQKVTKLGLGHCVTFLGWRDDLGQILSDWDIFVQPSLAEGLGIVTLEAMAEGLPVVAAAVGGLRELVVDGKTGWLVPPAQAEFLAEMIHRLVADPELRASMGVAGHMRVRQRFSKDRMVYQVARLYDDLLGTEEIVPL